MRQVPVGIGIVRIEPNCLLVILDGFLASALVFESVA
jgi:hypothetical protein